VTSHDRDQGWTREESRWIDGLLDEPSARRLEARLAADPDRGARLGAYRDAMDLWREDVDRVAGRLDTGRLAEQVLAGHGLEAERLARQARRYAAAAVLLIGLGLAGASAVGPRRAEAGRAPVQTALQLIEQERLDLQTAREWEVFPLVHAPAPSEER
jgi:hypothetical protein